MLLTGINNFKINNTNFSSINFSGQRQVQDFPYNMDKELKTDVIDFSYNPKRIKEFLVSDGLDETMAGIISKDEDTYKKYRDVSKSMISKKGKFIHQTSTEQGLQVLSIVNNKNVGKKSAKRIAALEALGINNAVNYGTHPDKYWRTIDLICEDEDGKAVLIDGNDEETVLKRPLTIREFNEITSPALGQGIFYDNKLAEDYIGIIDDGLNIKMAAKIASNKDYAKRYMQLTGEDKFGQTIIPGKDSDIMLSRKLTPQEAAAVILKKDPDITDKKVQNFIDLKEEGLEDFEAAKIASSNRDGIKFFILTTPEKDGSVMLLNSDSPTYVKLSRPLTPKEAAFGLNLENQNLQTYQKILDKGVSIGEAYVLASDIKRADKFFKLITPDEDEKVRLQDKNGQKIVLPRALSVNEALIATSELLPLKNIYHQLMEFDEVKSRQNAG